MKTFIIAYLSSILPMFAIDGVWLVTMSKRFYAARLGSLTTAYPKLAPAGVFCLLYTLGITLLVAVPAVNDGTVLIKVFSYGALLGLVAYGTYDLTNQATLKNWPVVVTVVDLVWGALLTGAVRTAKEKGDARCSSRSSRPSWVSFRALPSSSR